MDEIEGVETTELPDDYWHTYVFVSLACYCYECEAEADLRWAWDGLTADSSPGPVITFARRAVEYLLREGWQMIEDRPLCPVCLVKRTAATSSYPLFP